MKKKPVLLSKKAQSSFHDIMKFTEEKWGKEEFEKLKERTLSLINVIESNPSAFSIVDKNRDLRRAPLIKEISVFYRIRETRITILAFWHNSRNPSSLKL